MTAPYYTVMGLNIRKGVINNRVSKRKKKNAIIFPLVLCKENDVGVHAAHIVGWQTCEHQARAVWAMNMTFVKRYI